MATHSKYDKSVLSKKTSLSKASISKEDKKPNWFYDSNKNSKK